MSLLFAGRCSMGMWVRQFTEGLDVRRILRAGLILVIL